MQLSNFNLELPNLSTPTEVLLFNTLEGSLISLPQKEYNRFKISLSEGKINSKNDDIALLSELGFLESDNRNPEEKLKDWFASIQNDTKALKLTIVTTLACNFACPYCVQGDSHPVVKMKPSTCEDIFKFALREFEVNPFEELFVTYYGGEPLLNINAIKYFQKKFTTFCQQKDISFQSHLITNGSLLSRFANEIKDLKINSLKVTLDGTEDYHNKMRCYTNGKSSFDDIIKGLEQLPENIAIQIGSNFCDENYEGIKALPEFLSTSSISHKVKQFNSKPVMVAQKIRLPGVNKSVCRIYTDQVLRRWKNIQENSDLFDIPTKGFIEQGPCSYYNKRDVTIATDGSIYPCPSFIDSKEDCIGTIYDEEFSLERVPEIPVDDSCLDCDVFAFCAGGCRYASKLCLGSSRDLNCEKDFFKSALHRDVQKQFKIEQEEPVLLS